MESLIKSKYLQVVKRDGDYAIYNSIYGNLTFVDSHGIDFVNRFSVPTKINEVLNLPEYKSKDMVSYCVELKERGFLVETECDEYEPIEKNIEVRSENLNTGYLVRALQLVTSNDCNFKCKYCFVGNMYNSEERTEYQKSQANKQMSFEVAKVTIDNMLGLLRKNGHQYLNLEFFGGEPLMNWPVIKEVLEHFGNGKRGDVEILYSITTNGSLITQEMSEVFKKHNVAVVISFDSPSNSNRIMKNGTDGNIAVKRSVELLQKNGNWVAFNSVLSKETVGTYDGIGLVDFAKTYGISMIGLILDLDLEFYKDEENKKKVLKEITETYKYSVTNGIPIAGYWHQIFNQIAGKQALNLVSGYKTCPATGCKLSVEPEGHVFICKCCSGYIGHINDLDAVLNSDKYREYAMKAYRNAPECEGCEIEGFCAGVCMGSLEKRYNNMDRVEKSSCEIFKEITKMLINNADGTSLGSFISFIKVGVK